MWMDYHKDNIMMTKQLKQQQGIPFWRGKKTHMFFLSDLNI